jgi:hypothetical protein
MPINHIGWITPLFVPIESKDESPLTIDKETIIISSLRSKEKVYEKLNLFETGDNDIFAGCVLSYLEDLKLIFMGGDGAHRLCALDLYTSDNRSYKLERKYFSCNSINLALLKEYKLSSSFKEVYLDNTYIKSEEIYDLISFLQKHYLNNINEMNFLKVLFKKLKIHLSKTRAQRKFEKY